MWLSGLLWLLLCQTVGLLLFPLFDVWVTVAVVVPYVHMITRVRKAGGSFKTCKLYEFEEGRAEASTLKAASVGKSD